MLLVAPDPRMGIAPERIARVRVLLDAAPAAPGVAVALPGGADGVLDALILRPDGVLGLVPGPVAARSASRSRGSGSPGPGGLGTLEGGESASEEEASREVERLLALSPPASTAPRQIVAVPTGARADVPHHPSGPADSARLALTAALGAPALAAEEVHRLFVALRLADHVPGADALAGAGFTTHPSADRAAAAAAASAVPPTAPVATHRTPPASGRELPRTGRLPAQDAAPPASPNGSRGSRRSLRARGVPAWLWTWRGLAVVASAVFLVAVGGALVVVRTTATPAAAPAATDPTNPRVVGDVTFERRAQTVDSTCADHAYGLAAQFLRERACVRLDRSLWSGTSPQGPMVLAVSVVRMGDAQSAAALASLVDSSGTGNVADLLREGRTFPGAPAGLTGAGYGSRLEGDRVVIVESDWLDTSRADEPRLDQVAREAVDAAVGAG